MERKLEKESQGKRNNQAPAAQPPPTHPSGALICLLSSLWWPQPIPLLSSQLWSDSLFLPHCWRGSVSWLWGPCAQCQTGRPGGTVCCSSGSRTIALGEEELEWRLLFWILETNLSSTPSLPPPTIISELGLQPHLREVLLDDLQGSSHAVSSIQNYLNIMAHQVFRKERGGNQNTKWGPGP